MHVKVCIGAYSLSYALNGLYYSLLTPAPVISIVFLWLLLPEIPESVKSEAA